MLENFVGRVAAQRKFSMIRFGCWVLFLNPAYELQEQYSLLCFMVDSQWQIHHIG